ncbi:MAG: 50S ribosomal protein L22 [bacterium]|nr:50S ribosomal protein L22 [bacterium]
MAQQIAKLNYLKIAPRKVRLLASMLKGLSVNDAEAHLLHSPQRSAKALLKLLRSAVANAKNNQKLDTTRFFVQSIRVDNGPMLKRHLPRARGTASPIQKKMSHVILIIAETTKQNNNRFQIIVPKKIKDKDLKKKAKSKKLESIGAEKDSKEKSQEKRGILKRVFQRKSI